MKNSKSLKSPLRYPGGKSKLSSILYNEFPKFKEYREPFLGGGSVFLKVYENRDVGCSYWLNDFYDDLYTFWIVVKNFTDDLINIVLRWKKYL